MDAPEALSPEALPEALRLLAAGRAGEAVARLEGAPPYWRGLALRAAGRRGAALDCFIQAGADPAFAAAAAQAAAEVHLSCGHGRSAAAWARRALAARPGWPAAGLLLVRARLRQGRRAEALADALAEAERLAAAHPDDPDALAALGLVRFTGRRFAEAAAAFQAAARHQPALWLAVGRAWRLAGAPDRAVRPLRRALAANPQNRRAAALLAAVQAERGRFALAERALSHLLLLTDRAPWVLRRQAAVIAVQGRAAEAEALAEEAEAMAPALSAGPVEDVAALFSPAGFSPARDAPAAAGPLRRALALAGMDLRGRLAERGLAILWLVAAPLAGYALFVVVLRHLRPAQPAGMGLEWFLLSGLGPWFLFASLSTAVLEARRRALGLLAWPAVRVADLRLAAALVRGGVALLVAAVAALSAWATDGPPAGLAPWRLLAALAVCGALAAACGVAVDTLRAVWRSADEVWTLLTRALFLTCGAFFSLTELPPAMAGWLRANPLLHVVEQMRHALDPTFPTSGTGLVYPLAVAAGLAAAAWAAARRWPARLHEG